LANIRQGVGRILLKEVTNTESKNICEKLKLVQNFIESFKFVSYFVVKHKNTWSLKRGKTKITNNMAVWRERERERERDRQRSLFNLLAPELFF